MIRTLDNCVLIKKYWRPRQTDGVCIGFGKSETDDEPCEVCKRCRLNSNFEQEEEKK